MAVKSVKTVRTEIRVTRVEMINWLLEKDIIRLGEVPLERCSWFVSDEDPLVITFTEEVPHRE